MCCESCIVRFNNDIWNFGRGIHRESLNDSCSVFVSKIFNQESSQSAASSTSNGMKYAEPLYVVTPFSFLSNHVQHVIFNLKPFWKFSFCKVVSGASIPKNIIFRSEKGPKRASSDGIHRLWLQINQNASGDMSAPCYLLIVHICPFSLKIAFSLELAVGVDSVLITNVFPEFCSYHISALAELDIDNFSH